MYKIIMCGVSKYDFMQQLPMCNNDVVLLEESFRHILPEGSFSITAISDNGEIKRHELFKRLQTECESITSDENLIFYYSGHGGYGDDGMQYLIATDTTSQSLEETGIDASYMIDIIAESRAKAKLLIIDSCYSDNPETHNFDYETQRTIDESFDKGCSIFASSSIHERSFPYDNNNEYSAFTKFFCDAITDKYLNKNGRIYFNEVNNLIRIYANGWAKARNEMQTPVFRSNSYGVFTLITNETDSEVSITYEMPTILYSTNWFRVMNIDLQRKFKNGKYANLFIVKLVLDYKKHIDIEDTFKELISELINHNRCKGKETNILQIHIANELIDYENCIWQYILKYADSENRHWLDKPSKDVTILNHNITVKEISFYNSSKKQRIEHTISDDGLIEYWHNVLDTYVNNIEPVINEYRKYRANDVEYSHVIAKRKAALNNLNKLFFDIDDAHFPMPFSIYTKYDEICYTFAIDIRQIILSFAIDEVKLKENNYYHIEDAIKQYYNIFNKWSIYNKEVRRKANS